MQSFWIYKTTTRKKVLRENGVMRPWDRHSSCELSMFEIWNHPGTHGSTSPRITVRCITRDIVLIFVPFVSKFLFCSTCPKRKTRHKTAKAMEMGQMNGHVYEFYSTNLFRFKLREMLESTA